MIYEKVVPVKIVNYTFVKQPKIVKDELPLHSDPKIVKEHILLSINRSVLVHFKEPGAASSTTL